MSRITKTDRDDLIVRQYYRWLNAKAGRRRLAVLVARLGARDKAEVMRIVNRIEKEKEATHGKTDQGC